MQFLLHFDMDVTFSLSYISIYRGYSSTSSGKKKRSEKERFLCHAYFKRPRTEHLLADYEALQLCSENINLLENK